MKEKITFDIKIDMIQSSQMRNSATIVAEALLDDW